jgi:hypothetical protein
MAKRLYRRSRPTRKNRWSFSGRWIEAATVQILREARQIAASGQYLDENKNFI